MSSTKNQLTRTDSVAVMVMEEEDGAAPSGSSSISVTPVGGLSSSTSALDFQAGDGAAGADNGGEISESLREVPVDPANASTVNRVFLYEVVSGIRLSALAEEDGSSVASQVRVKKPRRHKHAPIHKQTTAVKPSSNDPELDAEFVASNPAPFLTREENPRHPGQDEEPRKKDSNSLAAEVGQRHGLAAGEFSRNTRWLLKTQPTDSGERLDVEIKTYAPSIFRRMRVADGVTTDSFCRSWNYKFSELPKMHTGAGRSGSLFLASSDARYFFKTLPYVEVQTLLDLLPALYDYLSAHPESRLMRVYNILRFSDPRRIHGYLYLIVFPNAFYSSSKMSVDEKYDLKGRVPKPGKEGRHTLTNQDPKRYVFKDNDIIDRKFLLHPRSRDHLMRALSSDVQFLQHHGCMDYSLLVGVHHLTDSDKDDLRRLLNPAPPSRTITTSSPATSVAVAASSKKPMSKPRSGSISSPTPSSSSSSSSQAPAIVVSGTSDLNPRSSGGSSQQPQPPTDASNSLTAPAGHRHRRTRSDQRSDKKSPRRHHKQHHKQPSEGDAARASTPPNPLDIVDHSAPKATKTGRSHLHRRSHSTSGHSKDAAAAAAAAVASGSATPKRRSTMRVTTVHSSRVVRAVGFISADVSETYFVSVIDFLARYTMAKKGAHFFKTFLWTPETLSTVPPDFYGRRWLSAMEQLFPIVPSNTLLEDFLGLPHLPPAHPESSSSPSPPPPASSTSSPIKVDNGDDQ